MSDTTTRRSVAAGSSLVLLAAALLLLSWSWRYPYPDLYAAWANIFGGLGLVVAVGFLVLLRKRTSTDRPAISAFTLLACGTCLGLTAVVLWWWTVVPGPPAPPAY